jgi:hypothetical protein
MERLNLMKLNTIEGKEQYQVEISNRFTALENLGNDVESNRAWETTRVNVKISPKEILGYYKLE